MGAAVYLLCATAALACTVLLIRAYRQSRARLLLWSAVCFGCLTMNNIMVAVDLIAFPDIDMFVLRNLFALSGIAALIYGLIWETR